MALGEFRENLFDIVGGNAANERLLGLNSGSVESIQKTGIALARTFDEARQLEAERSRKSASEIAFLSMLDQLNGQIANAESGFAGRYGEDWREQFAQRILEPDEIPQRRDGESMEDYRERLEQALIDKMLDDAGNINPEYLNDPELREWAEWAQWKFDQQQALELRNATSRPGMTDDEVREVTENFSETATFERLVTAQAEFSANEVHDQTLRDEADSKFDTELRNEDVASADNSFLS